MVGSSSSSRLGRVRMSRASARRVFSPPEKGSTGARRHVAAEVETAEVVAQFLFRRQRFEAAHVLQRRFVRAQLFELVLGEVADVQRLGFLALAALLGDRPPASSLISVDLPAPLRPSRPMRHAGTQHHADAVDDLALGVAGRGVLDAAAAGRAARSVRGN